MSERESLRLLVSVRDEIEAVDALSGGADWIDLKEPAVGPLGAVSAATALNIVRAVAGRCPLSAALGELVDFPDSPARELVGVAGISVVKLGLKGCGSNKNWRGPWAASFRACLKAGKDLAAVIYADWRDASAPDPDEVLEVAIEAGCRYLLIDTFNKNSGSSVALFSRPELARIVHIAQSYGIASVLAGNLHAEDFVQIAEFPVHMVAVRGAACQTDRTSRIDRERVSQLRHQLTAALSRAKDLTTSLTGVI